LSGVIDIGTDAVVPTAMASGNNRIVGQARAPPPRA
jgi:hypothetical protein